jgi:chromosome segregation ATPase
MTVQNIQRELSHLTENLRRERDELRLQAHLLKAELADEWHALEHRWDHFEQKAAKVSHVAADAAHEVGAAARLVGEELAQGYAKIRASLKS